MNIAYLLHDTAISGRVRSVLAQADALIARGHRVRIVSEDPSVTWRSSDAEWIEPSAFIASDEDVVIDDTAPPVRIVDVGFYRAAVPRDNDPLRVLLVGSTDIDDGYGAAAHARWFHQRFDFIRVSPYAPSQSEPLDGVQEFHVALSTPEMIRVMHSCDIAIAPRFGLAVAEAMAAGLAVVSIDGETNAVDLGERLIEVSSNEELRAELRVRGREMAEEWRSEGVGAELERRLKALR